MSGGFTPVLLGSEGILTVDVPEDLSGLHNGLVGVCAGLGRSGLPNRVAFWTRSSGRPDRRVCIRGIGGDMRGEGLDFGTDAGGVGEEGEG
jgi:hypothetical protein